jgi:hypothetical protein
MVFDPPSYYYPVANLSTSQANGVFVRTDEVKNGRPVFVKVGRNGAVCCWMTASSGWIVSTAAKKAADEISGCVSAARWCITARREFFKGNVIFNFAVKGRVLAALPHRSNILDY